MKSTVPRMKLAEAARRLSELEEERETIRRHFPELLDLRSPVDLPTQGSRTERHPQDR